MVPGSPFAYASRAQQLPPGIDYNGQPVVTVNLIARPTMEVDAFRPLVTQRGGKPYSQKLVDQSRAALQATHQFSKVDVNVTPEAGGLRVDFILQPAYYLGVIDFPGATGVFSYTQLLETVNYPVEDPYERGRVEQGRDALERFLVQHGYFRAKVAVQVELDQRLKLATVTYAVTLNPRARLGRIAIDGPAPREAADLKGALHSFHAWLKSADLKTGKRYSATRLQSAESFLRAYLGQQNHLAGTVRMARPQYDQATNRANITFDVDLGPKVLVKVTGAHVSRRELRKLVPIYQEYAVDRELAGEGQQNLLANFQSKGYFDAEVVLRFTREPSQDKVIYEVKRGRRHRVSSVNIVGNLHIDEDQLAGQITVKKAHLFSRGRFSRQLLDNSVSNLEAYYHDHGYLDVKVIPKTVDHEPNVDVTFQIEEGAQTTVESVKVEGNQTQSIGMLAPRGLVLHAGAPFSQSAIRRDRNRIVASYLDLGYPNASFHSTAAPVPGNRHRVRLTYQVEEGPHVGLSAVRYVGNQHTRRDLVARSANIEPGAPLSEGKLLAGESQLYNLGIFDWADVSPRHPPTDQSSSEDVLVRVHEAKRNSITYGVGFESTPTTGALSNGVLILPGLPAVGLPKNFTVLKKTVISPQGSLEYSRLNMRGRAETASVSVLASTLDQKLAFTYGDPHFRGTNWKSLLSVSAERTTQNPLFTARLGEASFQLSRALNATGNKRLQFEYDFQRTSLGKLLIENFIPAEDQNIRLSTLSASFVNDTRDKPLDAHRGVFQTLSLSFSPTFFGSSDNVARFFGQTAFYRQVKPWLVWANDFRLGLVSSFAGSHVPFSGRFFSGGADSLRGFPLNGAGPQTTALLCTMLNDPASCTAQVAVPMGGHALFILNSEGRFPLPIYHNLGGVIFYDGGNVYEGINVNHFLSGYSNTVGFGLRYNLPIGPIRFDIGRNLNPVTGQNAMQVFVTLGQAF